MKSIILFLTFFLILPAISMAEYSYRVHIKDFHPAPTGDGYYCSMYVTNLTSQAVRVSGVETNFLTSNTWNHFDDSVWTTYRAGGLTTSGQMVALWLSDQVRIVASVYPFDSLFIQPFEEKLFVTMQFNTNVFDPRKTIPERILMYIKEGGNIINVSTQVELLVGDLTGVMNYSNSTTEGFTLLQNYPNPFNPNTRITFTLPERSEVDVSIFDIGGRLVQQISGNVFEAGVHTLDWNASGLPSGTYLYRLNANGNFLTRSALLIK
jgi:hypothetical protein